MSFFDRVTSTWKALKYMDEARGRYLRDLIREHKSSDILELGFFQGKSSAYLAAILEDEGRGHLTTMDTTRAKERHPNIEQVLDRVGLSHRVTPIYAERSYTWEMGKLLAKAPREKFDLCYLDAGHTWDTTGFGFVLTDMLLRPGGIVVFDDLDWNMNNSMARLPAGHNRVPALFRG